jgi:hypothetical protein
LHKKKLKNNLKYFLVSTKIVIFNHNLKTKYMWINSISNAISEVEMNHPSLVSKVANLNPTSDDWSDQDWKDYNEVAAAIVEPFVFPDGESEDEEFYYQKTEEEGYQMVKGNLPGIKNHDLWIKIIDLVEKIGY